MEPLLVRGTPEEEIRHLMDMEKRLSLVQEDSPARDNSQASSSCQDTTDVKAAKDTEDTAETTREANSFKERDGSLSSDKSSSRGESEERSLEQESFSLEDVTFDNGQLASSGPTLTQAEVEATMKKVSEKSSRCGCKRFFFVVRTADTWLCDSLQAVTCFNHKVFFGQLLLHVINTFAQKTLSPLLRLSGVSHAPFQERPGIAQLVMSSEEKTHFVMASWNHVEKSVCMCYSTKTRLKINSRCWCSSVT